MREPAAFQSGRPQGKSDFVALSGIVSTGRGLASSHLEPILANLEAAFGTRFFPGSLNIVLTRPLQLRNDVAVDVMGDATRLFWPAVLNGLPVLVYRWQSCPLQVTEVVASTHLRSQLGLSDGMKVMLEIERANIQKVGTLRAIGWACFWLGRTGWYYTRPSYVVAVENRSAMLGLGQSREHKLLRRTFHKLPGYFRARRVYYALRKRLGVPVHPAPYQFHRSGYGSTAGEDYERVQVLNLLTYTKTSGASYAAERHPAGYHTIELRGERIQGQRDPAARMQLVPYDFHGKTVLDVGSNQGGMLFQLSDELLAGVGIDYDARMVNAANKIKSIRGNHHLNFFVFDLEREPLDLIRDFLPSVRVDIVFLLSVCMWIENWRDVMKFCASISDAMLFESNGTRDQQAEQVAALHAIYGEVHNLADESRDDPGPKRQMFLCRNPVAPLNC